MYKRKRLTSRLLSSYIPLSDEPPLLLGPQSKNVRLAPTVYHERRDSLSWDH